MSHAEPYPRCGQCGYVVAEPDHATFEGKPICGLCAETHCPKPAHAADCPCRVCESRELSRKDVERARDFYLSKPSRKFAPNRGR